MGANTQKTDSGKKKSLFLWVFAAGFALSLLLHAFFLKKAGSWVVRGFSAGEYDQIVPRTFHMERVEIDPKTLEAAPEKNRDKRSKESPTMPVAETPRIEEKPGTATLQPLSKPAKSEMREDAENPAQGLQGIGMESLIPKNPQGIEVPEPSLPRIVKENDPIGGLESGVESDKGNTPSYSSLDELLAGTGKVSSGMAPILMPTDLLFEYDSAMLRPDAAQALEKLGTLIRRNAIASFRIEGHTDSFGSDQYNDGLSLRRAAAVKEWLGKNMGIDPSRISAAGLGKAHLLVPGTGSVAEQQLNRRVEIVILSAIP